MKSTEHGISESKTVENMYHLRLMALLQEQVRKRGTKGAAMVLEIDPKKVAESIRTGQFSRRTRDALEWALQEGIGSAAECQRERNEKLEARFYKLEAQVRELREDHRTDLKRLRMSLDGVRKYYGVQRRQIDQRLSALEKDRIAGTGQGRKHGLVEGRVTGNGREWCRRSWARGPTRHHADRWPGARAREGRSTPSAPGTTAHVAFPAHAAASPQSVNM